MYVTTNLPVTKKWSGKVHVVPLDASRGVIEVELEVAKNGTIKSLKNAVGQILGLEPKHLIVTEEWKGKFYRDWFDDEMVTEIAEHDRIILYETSAPYPQPRRFGNRSAPAIVAEDGTVPIIAPVFHKKLSSRGSATRTFGISDNSESFGMPFVVTLTPQEASSVADVKRAVARQYARITTRGDELLQLIEEEIAWLEREAELPIAAPAQEEVAAAAPESAESAQSPSPQPEAMEFDAASEAPAAPSIPPTDAGNASGQTSSLSSSTASLEPLFPTTDNSAVATSSASSARTTPSRKTAFRVQVSREPVAQGRAPLGQERTLYGSNDGLVDIEELAAASAGAGAAASKAEEDIDMFGPGSAKPADGAAPEQAEPEPAAAAADEQQARRPLFTIGHTVTVTWEAGAYDYFLGEEVASWRETQSVVDPSLVTRRQQGKGAKRTITLSDCLTEFTKEERLGEDDMWYCSSCKEHKQATKKVELWKVPDVLVFALKRFSSSRYSRDKIDDLVDFPVHEALDMEPFVMGDRVEKRLAEQMADAPHITEPDSLTYELYGVSNHFGGLGGGHYTAFAKNPENGRWYDFDDVSKVLGRSLLDARRSKTDEVLVPTVSRERDQRRPSQVLLGLPAVLPSEDCAADRRCQVARAGRVGQCLAQRFRRRLRSRRNFAVRLAREPPLDLDGRFLWRERLDQRRRGAGTGQVHRHATFPAGAPADAGHFGGPLGRRVERVPFPAGLGRAGFAEGLERVRRRRRLDRTAAAVAAARRRPTAGPSSLVKHSCSSISPLDRKARTSRRRTLDQTKTLYHFLHIRNDPHRGHLPIAGSVVRSRRGV